VQALVECPQPRSLFSHCVQFSVVLGRWFLRIPQVTWKRQKRTIDGLPAQAQRVFEEGKGCSGKRKDSDANRECLYLDMVLTLSLSRPV
jgi:hypothetical protein